MCTDSNNNLSYGTDASCKIDSFTLCPFIACVCLFFVIICLALWYYTTEYNMQYSAFVSRDILFQKK